MFDPKLVIDGLGHFGPYGGRFVPEALIGALEELEAAHVSAVADPIFQAAIYPEVPVRQEQCRSLRNRKVRLWSRRSSD